METPNFDTALKACGLESTVVESTSHVYASTTLGLAPGDIVHVGGTPHKVLRVSYDMTAGEVATATVHLRTLTRSEVESWGLRGGIPHA